MRGVVVFLVVVGCAVAGRAQDGPPGEPLEYAVFAGADARLGPRVQVYGRVGSNGSVRIGRQDEIGGLVASPTIEVRRGTETGPLFCILVVGGQHPCLPVASPVVSPGSLGVGLILPGEEDIDVPRRAHRAPLEAGSYHDLRLGRGSELLLLGGDYLFERVKLSRKASLRCATACRIAVRRTLRVGRRATIAGPDALGAVDIRFDVTGHRSRAGVRLGARASLAGLVWAPTTRVVVGRRAKVAVGVHGEDIRIGARARIGTAPAPPAE